MKITGRLGSKINTGFLTSQSTVSVKVRPYQWCCLSGYHAKLFGPDSPNWADLDQENRAQLVKENPLRRVYRVTLKDLEVYAKVYRKVGLANWWKWKFRPLPNQVEFRQLQIAHMRQVPVVKPLAWSRNIKSGNRQVILLTESLGETISLEEMLWSQDRVDPEELAVSLHSTALLLGRLHCAGILHGDLHPGNILFVRQITPVRDEDQEQEENQEEEESPATDSLFQAYITDLQNARFEQRGGHASAEPFHPARIANTGMVFAALRHTLSLEQLDQFLGTYLQTMQPNHHWIEEEVVRYRQQAHVQADEHDRRIWAQRDRRALRDSRYAKKLPTKRNWEIMVHLQLKRPLDFSPASRYQFNLEQWRSVLADPMILTAPGRFLKEGSRTTVVARTLTLGGTDLSVVAKHTKLRTGWRGVLESFCSSRALKQWKIANALITRGLPTPLPLAVLEQYRFILLKESIFLCEEITRGINLKVMVLKDLLPKSAGPRRDLIFCLARMLAKLRKRGFTHRDCKISNILVQHRPNQSPCYQVFLVDLDGLQLPNRILNHLHSKEHEALIRMASSAACLPDNGIQRTDYLRFFYEYLRSLDLPEANDRQWKKLLWRQMVPQVNQKAAEEKVRTQERAGIADIRDLKKEVSNPETETHSM
jgi:tRNA A-37 threonylcarbamoyl transferase component Bud32